MKLTTLFRDFFQSEKVGGFLLVICTILSLAITNSSFGEAYNSFWHKYIDLSFSSIKLNYTIGHWINDGLMTIFFLLVGLEIERELYKGELRTFQKSILPIGAAVGGMLVPALIYIVINAPSGNINGFGIPMATDIAFALGMLALAGNRVPVALKVFLAALAIIDDLGAILVIALFYNTGIAWIYLVAALFIFTLLMVFNKAGLKNLLFFLLPGVVMWYCMLQSGVHPTITGVLLAIALPFSKNEATNPSYILQHALHKPVAYFILPVFALANTGIALFEGWQNQIISNNSLGIIAGLVVGKPIGILLFCWLLVKLKIAKLPTGVNWHHLAGAGVLAGIGFTMSIFISNLAFTEEASIEISKIAVLLASLVASIIGLSIFFTMKKKV